MKTRLLLVLALFAFLAASACGSDFTPKNQVNTVRILAARADVPYARPGETVHIEALIHDGRATKAEPMRIYWFPAPCVDPIGNLYYACYPLFDLVFPIGVDLTPFLREAKDTTVTVPLDAIDRAATRPGQTSHSGTLYAFMVACPGHVERVPRDHRILNAVPVGCFTASGQRVAAEDFVFGFTRVFVFADRRNTLPVLDGVVFEGKPIDPAVGVVTGRCEKDSKTGECKTVKLNVLFNDAIAETDPENVDVDGVVGRETIYVDWFTSVGKFNTDRKIVFDGNLGRPPKTDIEYEPPPDPAKGTIWAVLHDNRGGTTWREFPLEIR